MLQESVFHSDDLSAGDRFDAWRERMGLTHAPMRLESERAADYHAHQRLIGLGVPVTAVALIGWSPSPWRGCR
jgi:hypothetical protein